MSAFCFLFSEMVQYEQNKVDTTQELEKKLAENGYSVGLRMSELCFFREKNAKREVKIVGILSYIKDNIWKTMFGKAADSLERATDKQDECEQRPPHFQSLPTPEYACALDNQCARSACQGCVCVVTWPSLFGWARDCTQETHVNTD